MRTNFYGPLLYYCALCIAYPWKFMIVPMSKRHFCACVVVATANQTRFAMTKVQNIYFQRGKTILAPKKSEKQLLTPL